MKTIIVYIKDSCYKYPNIYGEYFFSVTDFYHLEIFKRNKISGEEAVVANFKNWDYFVIEEEADE